MELEVDTDLKTRIVEALEEARARTNWLLDPVDDERLVQQHNRLMSPLVWDAGHIGVFEELWLFPDLTGSSPVDWVSIHAHSGFHNPKLVPGSPPLLNHRDVAALPVLWVPPAVQILDDAHLH